MGVLSKNGRNNNTFREGSCQRNGKKMRKLVRALALREKNLRLRHPSLLLSSSSSSSKENEDDNVNEDEDEDVNEKPTIAKTTVKSTSSFNPMNPPTTRGRR